MKLNKKVIIPVAAVLVVGVIGFNAVQAVGGKPTAQIVDTYAVAVGDLSNTVDVTGMVESGNSVNIYTTLGYPVKSIDVEVGDVVAEGDVLCVLDTAALESNIRQTEASLGNAQAKANFSLSVAQKDLETFQQNVEGNYNSSLLTAESTVRKAEEGVEGAEIAVKEADARLRKAQTSYADVRKTLRDYREDKKQVEDGELYDDVIHEYQQLSIQAEIDVETCELGLENAKKTLETAKAALRDAEASKLAIEKQVEESESSTQDQVSSAQLNANLGDQYIALDKLKADLEDAVIKAPCAGTVTAVYAKEGASAVGGPILVIEDTDDLKIKTRIKEYDIASVNTGLPVVIKADGTGDAEFEGTLSKIAPTTLKDATGGTISTSSAEFEAEVRVTSRSSLRIGMNARMNIITEQRKNIFMVPLECIAYDADGNEVVYVYTEQEDGTAIAKMVPVVIGMETDLFCEIAESGLAAGNEVITDPTGLVDGVQVMRVAIQVGGGDSQAQAAPPEQMGPQQAQMA